MERHPAAEEEQRCNARHDKQVEVLGKVEEAEVHTRIFGMITGGKLTRPRKVERTAVGLGGTGNHIDYKVQ